MPDCGLTHVALPVTHLDRSIAFYAKYAGMQVVHRRGDKPHGDPEVAWLCDMTRAFVIVLAEAASIDHPLGPFAHLGVACKSRADVDRLVELAKAEGCFRDGPFGDEHDPAGYLVNLADPDGHTLELSFGQNVTEAIDQAQKD